MLVTDTRPMEAEVQALIAKARLEPDAMTSSLTCHRGLEEAQQCWACRLSQSIANLLSGISGVPSRVSVVLGNVQRKPDFRPYLAIYDKCLFPDMWVIHLTNPQTQ